jgi:multidrug efflux pump subunit AcrB
VFVAALFVSLIEGFLILPGHLAHKRKRTKEPGPIRQAFNAFGEARHRFFEQALPGLLEIQLRFMLRWRYATAGLALAMLPIVAGLVASGIVPFVFLPDTDAETLTADLEMAAGTPEAETERILGQIEEMARSKPEVASTFSVIGASFGERGRQAASDPAVVGQITIEMVAADERERVGQRKSQAVLTELRKEAADLPGVRRLSFAGRSGGPSGPDIQLRLRGDDLDVLQKAVVYAREHIATYAGIEEMYDDFELGKLEARMRLREDARLLGLTTRDVALHLRHALYGFEVQDLQVGEDEVTVRVLLPESERRTLEDLGRVRIGLPNGARVPLSEAATFDMDRGYAALIRVDGKRAATITAQVNDDIANSAQVTKDVGIGLADIGTKYPGVSLSFEGRRKETRESMGSLQYLFPIALLLIYAIIAVLFRSYLQPFIVMSIIPFAIVGAVLGHLIMGFPITILSLIGLVALAGIVVNDGLILVDLANRKRREGLPLLEAIVAAAKGRMRAILLTSITTCVGLAPIMLETSFQAQFLIPMAISIVFGLAFATFLILALLPVFYLCLEDVRSGVRWLFGSRWHQELGYDPGVEIGKDVT